MTMGIADRTVFVKLLFCTVFTMTFSCALFDECGALLKDPSHAYDYLMVVYDPLFDATSPLVWHKQAMGLRVAQAKTSEVTTEFGPGEAGLKDFLTYAYNSWSQRPEYVFLIGGVSHSSAQVPTHRFTLDYSPDEAIWDDWLVCVDGIFDVVPDMCIGRLPAQTPEEVSTYVAKLIEYERDCTSSIWKKKVFFLSDDTFGEYTADNKALLLNQVSNALDIVAGSPIGSWQTKTLYTSECNQIRDEFSKQDSSCHRMAIREVNWGQAIICATGLSANNSQLVRTIRGYWLLPDDLRNEGMYPIVLGMSCMMGKFDEDSTIIDKFLFQLSSGA